MVFHFSSIGFDGFRIEWLHGTTVYTLDSIFVELTWYKYVVTEITSADVADSSADSIEGFVWMFTKSKKKV